MEIAVIGAGNLGAALARRLAAKGHNLFLSYSRDPSKLEATARQLGVRAGNVRDAVCFAKVIILATPYTTAADALKEAASSVRGKIIWDCTNPLKADFSGLLLGTDTSAGEANAALVPGAQLVKAIPPFAEVLRSQNINIGGAPPSVFVCGDDESSRRTVADLIKDVGADPVILGDLALSRYVEPANMLLVTLAYKNGFGPRIGLSLRRS